MAASSLPNGKLDSACRPTFLLPIRRVTIDQRPRTYHGANATYAVTNDDADADVDADAVTSHVAVDAANVTTTNASSDADGVANVADAAADAAADATN